MKGIRLAAEQKQKQEKAQGRARARKAAAPILGKPRRILRSQATPETSSSKPQTQAVSAVNYQVYTVEEGETLYGICFKLYQNLGHIDEICRVNALADQNSIYAGQKLLVP